MEDAARIPAKNRSELGMIGAPGGGGGTIAVDDLRLTLTPDRLGLGRCRLDRCLLDRRPRNPQV